MLGCVAGGGGRQGDVPHADRLREQVSRLPTSSDAGTCKTVKARFWPWLSGARWEDLLTLWASSAMPKCCGVLASQLRPAQEVQNELRSVKNAFASQVPNTGAAYARRLAPSPAHHLTSVSTRALVYRGTSPPRKCPP